MKKYGIIWRKIFLVAYCIINIETSFFDQMFLVNISEAKKKFKVKVATYLISRMVSLLRFTTILNDLIFSVYAP